MASRIDIVVESVDRKPVLVVECKASTTVSAGAAAQLRDYLLSGFFTNTQPFALVALTTEFHLWKPESALAAPPDASAPAESVLRDYLGRVMDRPQHLKSQPLQIAVTSWLRDLAGLIRPPHADSEADQMLVRTGLYDRLQGGCVRTEVQV